MEPLRRKFNWNIFWLTLLGGTLAHCGTNMINDYFDHTSRNDEANKLFSPFNGGSRVIQSGLMAPMNVLIGSLVCFLFTIIIGLELNSQVNGSFFATSPLLYVGIIGIFLAIMYTGFLRLAYNGLGDLAVFLGFGPVMVYGSAYMQNQAVDFLTTMLISIPVGIFIALVLFINCFQDYKADKSTNKNSWVVRLAGPEDKANYRKPFNVWQFFMIVAFVVIALNAMFINALTGIALLPIALFYFGLKKGRAWLSEWEKEDAVANSTLTSTSEDARLPNAPFLADTGESPVAGILASSSDSSTRKKKTVSFDITKNPYENCTSALNLAPSLDWLQSTTSDVMVENADYTIQAQTTDKFTDVDMVIMSCTGQIINLCVFQ